MRMSDWSSDVCSSDLPDNGPTTIDAERASGVAITELLAGFMQELRQAGLPVSLTENLDAMEAVKHIPIEDREAFQYRSEERSVGKAGVSKGRSRWSP